MKISKIVRVLYTLYQASPNGDILYSWSTTSEQENGTGALLLTRL